MKKQRSILMSLSVAALIGGLAAVVVMGPGGLMAQEPERQWVQSGLPGLAGSASGRERQGAVLASHAGAGVIGVLAVPISPSA